MKRENAVNSLTPGPHPAIAPILLAAGACLMIMYSFLLLDNVPEGIHRQFIYKSRLGAGAGLWALGCAVVARGRQASIILGAFCGLFLMPGLLLLTFLTRHTREKALATIKTDFMLVRRRQARHVRALY